VIWAVFPEPETDQLPLHYFHVEPGSREVVAIVIEVSEPVTFESTPPDVHFGEGTRIDYRCYCNETYEVAQEGTLARVMEFEVPDRAEPGDVGVAVYPVDGKSM